MMGGFSVFCFLLMGIAGYLPVRFINFPVRVTLMFLVAAFREYCVLGRILFFAPLVLLGLSFAGYYILAFKYK